MMSEQSLIPSLMLMGDAFFNVYPGFSPVGHSSCSVVCEYHSFKIGTEISKLEEIKIEPQLDMITQSQLISSTEKQD